MKVLMTTDTVGGVLTYTAELAAALEAAGDEVAVATMGARLQRRQREALPARVHESGFRLEWMEDPWDDVAAAGEWLLRLEEEEQPDVVHLCSYAHGALPFKAPKVLVAHSCVPSWWRAVHGTEAPASWNRYREEMSAGLSSADAIVAPTHAMLTELEHDHALPPDTAQVIPNGTTPSPDTNCIKFSPQQRENLMQFADRGFVLGAGRFWDAAKNLAALDFAAEGLSWPVVLAGDLGDGEESRYAKSVGLLDSAELAELRREASIYAAPAVYEPFGLGILEAARDGCALVLGDIPSLRELWTDAAIFVDPREPEALHAVLDCLIDTPHLREHLAARAQRRAAGYSIDRTAAAYRRLYRRLVDRKRTSSRIAERKAFSGAAR
ncbi:MAG: glycosyltransferase family 4 protein [Solirubrobacterales bacterium]